MKFIVLLCTLLVSSNLSAQNNQTLINHKKSRDLNREGYRAYLREDWDLALKKFGQSIELDPYYTYPLYNSACVLSRRGRSTDSLRIFRLLMEVLLQETGPSRSVHQAKMQKDPDLAWFRRTEPELFIALNDIVLNYNVNRVYRKLRRDKTWNISLNRDAEFQESYGFGEDETFRDDYFDEDESITVTPDDDTFSDDYSITVTPADEPYTGLIEFQDSDDSVPVPKNSEKKADSREPTEPREPREPAIPKEKEPTEPSIPPKEDTQDPNFDPFSDLDESNPFGDPRDFPGYDEEGSEEFFPLVPQSLRQQYNESELTLNLISQEATSSDERIDLITFNGYRYRWNFRVGRRLFEMSGFFVVRGNVLILETFASSPKELRGLPFDWPAFRSLFFIYQPQNNEFYAINLSGDRIEIY